MKSTLNLKEQASLNSSNCYNYHNNNDNDSEGYNKKLFPCVHTSVCHILPILHPYQAFHVAWDILVIICLTFSCVQIPFLFAFDLPIDTNDGLGIFTLMIDIFLCIDICIQFRTAYYDEYDPLRLITCPILIAKRYLRFWFWFDLITSFPFDYILGGFHQGFAHYFKVLRLIRLIRVFRIIRVIRLLNHTGGKVRFSSSTLYKLSIFKIMFSMAFIAHLMACLWYLVGITMVETYNENSWVIVAGLNEENVTLFEKYSTSFYWAIITLFTTGYGDITAHNTAEQWVAILAVAIGSVFTAWFIGTFSALITEDDTQTSFETQAVVKAQLFCNHYNLDPDLRRAIISHTKYFYHYNFVASTEDDVLNVLPLYLQKQIKKSLANPTVNKKDLKTSLQQIDLFKDLSYEALGELVLNIKCIACSALSKVFMKGDDAKEIYIQRVGKSKLYNDNTRKLLKRGNIAGEYCLKNNKRNNTLICSTWSEFYVLKKQDIINCIQKYYDITQAQKIWANIDIELNKKYDIPRKVNLDNEQDADSPQTVPVLAQIATQNTLKGWGSIPKISSNNNNDDNDNLDINMNNNMDNNVGINIDEEENEDFKQEEELKEEVEMIKVSSTKTDELDKSDISPKGLNAMFNRLRKRKSSQAKVKKKKVLHKNPSELRNDKIEHHYKSLSKDPSEDIDDADNNDSLDLYPCTND